MKDFEHTGTGDVPSHIPKQIGPYHIRDVLGQGGMGTVYLAEQFEPVRREVALKLINMGMEQEWVMARFQLERQALALMNHPNIAAVYDAGSADDIPYFAMELVKGESLIKYCDRSKMPNHDRLKLFLQVCDGVQHAHQKMVIHRDLKPSNILVAQKDGRPIPKIIDFGVAKPTADTTMMDGDITRHGAYVGTPMYMSPEQIEGEENELDVRVDVYALGILLYQLLTGALPFDTKGSPAHRLLVRVMEEEPPIPSIRVNTLGDTTVQIAANHGTDEKSLRSELKGDLDWIIMRAIEKDRNQRYGSVTELKADLERHLAHQPVLATPLTAWYRVGKFIRRNRVGSLAALVVFVSLVGGIVGTTQAMLQARQAQAQAEQSESNAKNTVAYLRKLLSSVDPQVDGRTVRVVDLLAKAAVMVSDELEGQPETEAEVRKTIGSTYLELGMYDEAHAEIQRTIDIQTRILGEDHIETLHSINLLGRLLYKRGRYRDAENIHHAILQKQTRQMGYNDPTTQWTLYNLAKTQDKQGRLEEAETNFRKNLKVRREVLGPDHPHTLITINSLSLLLGNLGKLDEAEELQRTNLTDLTRVLGPESPNTLNCKANLVSLLNKGEKWEEALVLATETMTTQRKVFGDNHPEVLETANQIAWALQNLNRFIEAEGYYRQTLEARIKVLGEEHPNTIDSRVNLAVILSEQGRHEESAPMFEKSLNAAMYKLPKDHWKLAVYKGKYGRCLVQLKLFDQAKALLVDSYQSLPDSHGDAQKEIIQSLVALYEEEGNAAEANRYRQLLDY